MSKSNKVIKRFFDFLFAFCLLLVFCWLMIILIIISTIDTGEIGVFFQNRVGKDALSFQIYKIRTMKSNKGTLTTVTTSFDNRLTVLGRFLRRYKFDELPQLINVLKGDMSFVGPRPDVLGFADQLQGDDRIILSVRPGITGPASLFFRNEEVVLGSKKNPEKYNKEIIWPKKVLINKEYIKQYSFKKDCYYIIQTLLSL